MRLQCLHCNRLYLIDGLWVDKPLWGITTGCYTVWGSDVSIEAAHIANSCSTGAGIGTARALPDHVMQTMLLTKHLVPQCIWQHDNSSTCAHFQALHVCTHMRSMHAYIQAFHACTPTHKVHVHAHIYACVTREKGVQKEEGSARANGSQGMAVEGGQSSSKSSFH